MTNPGFADQLWQPATFLERGVAVPFTTPVLAGTRARQAKRAVELVVPHPAGARGVYIMAWSELANFCAATLHDLRLGERVASLCAVTPNEVRRAARAVAAEGAAGRPARTAAHAAEENDRMVQLGANETLLQMLVQQAGGGACAPAELDRRAKAVILALSPQLGRAAAAVTNDLEKLAQIFASVGLGAALDQSRYGKLVVMLERLRAALTTASAPANSRAAIATSLVLSGTEVTLRLARRMLAEIHECAADLPALLASMGQDATGTAAMLSRPEWLLDGWEQICLIHQLADETNFAGAVSEMALMVPTIPKEAEEWEAKEWAAEKGEAKAWGGMAQDEGERQRLRRLVHHFEDWRTGSLVYELIARNERLRALAA